MATVPQFPAGTLARSALNTFVTETTTNLTDTNIAAGANIAISKTALGTYTPWTTWSVNCTADTGTLTTITNNLVRYTQIGKTVICRFDFTITDKGTGGGALRFTVPVTESASGISVGNCHEYAITAGTPGTVYSTGSGYARIYTGTGGSPLTNTYRWAGTLVYEAA